MPSREQPPQKKRRAEGSSKQVYKYSSAKEIQRALKAQSEAALIEGLVALRNQLTVKPSEPVVAVNDGRLLLAKEWLEADPGAQELFGVWETANARQMSLLAAVVGVVVSLLNLLSSHYTYHTYAQPILRVLLSQQWMHHLNLYLSGQHTELTLVTLKLFNSMSNFAGGRERKVVLEAFAWEMKSLPKLLHMRRKSKAGEEVDALQRPDIRTLYILLVLSFLDVSTSPSVKAAFLEQHRDAFISMFKGLWQDSYSVIRRVLEVCWTGLWSDAKLKRTLKIQVFSEATLSQLLRIYERSTPESADPESVPADVVHHFLLALCSHPGVGLCFHDRGWYPRETDGDKGSVDADERNEGERVHKGGRIYNKILANVLRTLKVNEDPRQQELALKILAACPELVAGYWSSAGLALEPRLSSKWLANIAFFGAVVSLPVPTSSFVLPSDSSASLYRPAPPPLTTILENILPTAQIKIHLSRGLQAPTPLVQHASALALAKCLLKYDAVVRAFLVVERALEEDAEDGLWARRRRELEREIRKRVPEFQVIVGLSQRLNEGGHAQTQETQNKEKSKEKEKEKQKERAPNPTRTALLTESAHRLLWLYHRLLPAVVAEARFDAGKLLQAIEEMLLQGSAGSPSAGLDTLRQLHVLRLLRESEHFTWSGKSGSKHSNFHILLKAYVITPVPAVRTAIVALLRHILSAGVLFQHDVDEIALWLDPLPLTRRSAGAQAPDGSPLTDEGDGVITFLDDCVQRCVKTPYKYVEELQILRASTHQSLDGETSSIGERPEAYPSPLLATVLEQLGAKLQGKHLSPSDALALLAYVRKLTLRIASKSVDLALPTAFAWKIFALVEGQGFFPRYPTIEAAIRREASLFRDQMGQLQNPQEPMDLDTTPAVQEFLSQVESMVEPTTQADRQTSAYELVDWLRLIGPRLHPSELSRLVRAVERFHPPALKELVQYLSPRKASLLAGLSGPSEAPLSSNSLGFETLFMHCTPNLVNEEVFRKMLVEQSSTSYSETAAVKRAVRMILHRLSASSVADGTVGDYLRLLAAVIQKAQEAAQPADSARAAVFCFEAEIMKSLCSRSLPTTAREGLSVLLAVCWSNCTEDLKQVFAGFINRWTLALRESMDSADEDQVTTALLWFEYASVTEVLGLLDYLVDRAEHSSSPRVQEVIEGILDVTAENIAHEQDAITQAISLFSRMQSLLPKSSKLQSLLASGTEGSLPLGFNGYPPARSLSNWNMASLVPRASKRWSLRREPMPALSVESLLSSEEWTDAAVDILTTLLYRQQSARAPVIAWLESSTSRGCDSSHLVKLIFALYDSAREGDAHPSGGAEAFVAHFSRLTKVAKEGRHPHDVCSMAAFSIATILEAEPSSRSVFLKLLSEDLADVSPERLTQYSLAVAVKLIQNVGAEVLPLGELLVDIGLRWAVRHFADKSSSSEASRALLSYLGALIRVSVSVKSHLAEPVMAVVIQEQLTSIECLSFLSLLATSTNLKPVTVNKYLQTIVQHTRFYELCAVSVPSRETTPRDAIIHFLHTLFLLHPNNTCQPSHVEPLRRVYGGSLGAADRRLLSIFKLFEATRKTSVATLLTQWSGTADVQSRNSLEALQSLEPARVLKTCLEFPEWRKLEADCPTHALSEGLYEPSFVLLLFAQMLAESTPDSALMWVQLFRTNVFCLLLRMLSAKDAQMREIAWAQTASLYRTLESADLQEKPHVMHILNLLKDLTAAMPSDDIPRLPAYTTLLLAHAFRGIFYPSNFIYPLTARFLLQRPTLDPADVPMLYGMLYSSSDDWKKERAWIVRFLSDGIAGNEEWKILRRRHTWDLLASLFQSEERDKTLRRGVLEVLANITCNARATTSLVLRHALLSWIEVQLPTMRSEEAIAWARVLENVLTVVNPTKMESATNGEWRAIASRCLRTILHHSACSPGVFLALVPVTLRLALLPGRPASHIAASLARCVRCLEEMEVEVAIPTSGHLSARLQAEPSETAFVKLHHSQHLFDPPPAPSIEQWGECVEALWRVAMASPHKTVEWDALSSLLLLWRSIAGSSRTPVGEWARREVLENLRADP
ncbi:ribosome 60S biogenesis N-terminal-domain-containing protein [Trametes maxima]|nr:ribosome 60S biogenesis N-terminal-domain-containing protein [Trametes maxima]